ncbi:MAG: PD-(D/E)XK nuclease family protein [Planctomycetota bacterium]
MREPLQNTFSWSFSRSRTFTECPRKYWFHYYGSWGGWERDADPEARELYRLKKLTGLHLIAGDTVHRAIERALQTFKQGVTPDIEALVGWCKSEMSQALKDSREELWRENPSQFVRLAEHEYGPQPTRDTLVKIARKVGGSLRNFFVSVAYGMIKESDPERWLPMETLDTFDFEGTEVFAVPDFALRREDFVYIFDWKTGRKNKGNEDQVVLYALFAEAKWGADPDKVRAAPVYLLEGGTYDPQAVTEEDRERVRGMMRDSIGAMRERLADAEANVARKEDYEPLPGRACRFCNFRAVCPHAQ